MALSVRGTITSPEGALIRGVRVAALQWVAGDARSRVIAFAFSNQLGRFAFQIVPSADGANEAICAVSTRGGIIAVGPDPAALGDQSIRLVVGGDPPSPTVLADGELTPLIPPPAELNDGYSVSGHIRWPDGRPAASVIVRAVDRDLRHESRLSPGAPEFETETRTGIDGGYTIRYDREQFLRADVGSADIIVRALDEGRNVCANSSIMFNAPREALIDLELPPMVLGQPSEYERLVVALAPLLGAEPPEGLLDLTRRDVTFLAGDTGLPVAQLTGLLEAVALVGDLKALNAVIPVEVLYGLIRAGAPSDLANLRHVDEAVLLADLRAAWATGIVPISVADSAEADVREISRCADESRSAFLADITQLAAPTSRYARTGDVSHPFVDAELDQALASALVGAIGLISGGLGAALRSVLGTRRWRDADPDSTLAEIIVAGLHQVRTLDNSLAAEASAAAAQLPEDANATVGDTLHLLLPLQDNPILLSPLRAATAIGLARLAGLDEPAVRAVADMADTVFDAPDSAYAQLQAGAELTGPDVASLATLVNLGSLTDHNLPLILILREQESVDPYELATWTEDRWNGLLHQSGAICPPDLTMPQYISMMMFGLELVHPTQALAARLTAGDDLLATFFENNPRVDLRTAVLVADVDGQFEWSGIPLDSRPDVRTALASYRRLLTIADTTSDRVTLARNGFDSSVKIAMQSEGDFISNSGLDIGAARLVYARALNTATNVAHLFGAAHDVLNGPFAQLPVTNVPQVYVDDLLKIDGITELFGSQNFCDCSDCRSVLSPAAYFVDLMHFVQSHISSPTFGPIAAQNSPLQLKQRRPDLWSLILNCDNTNTLLPDLEIVDDVLEAYLKEVLLAEPYSIIGAPSADVSFNVPFSRPYAEFVLYLSYFGLVPADVCAATGQPQWVLHRTETRLSPVEFDVVVTANPSTVIHRLGLSNPADLAEFPVSDFLRRTGLSRGDLTVLLGLRHDPGLAAVAAKTIADPHTPDRRIEVLANLTAEALDRIHRVLRLARPLPWTLTELDLVLLTLSTVSPLGNPPNLTAAVVQSLGRWLTVQKQWALTVPQLCCLIGDIPVSTFYPQIVPPGRTGLLYEQIFDLEGIFGLDTGTTLKQSVSYYNRSKDPAQTPSGSPVEEKMTGLLLSGLGISESDLLLLLDQVVIVFDDHGKATLDRKLVSLLYRHVVCARALGLTVQDFVAVLPICLSEKPPTVQSVDQVEALVSLGRWLATAPLTLPQLNFVLRGIESGQIAYNNTAATAEAMVLSLGDAAASTGPMSARTTAVTNLICSSLNIGQQRLDDLLAFARTDLTAFDAEVTAGPLLTVLRALERVILLFRQLQADDDTLRYLNDNRGPLGLFPGPAPTLSDIRALASYRAFSTRAVTPSTTVLTAVPVGQGSGVSASALTQELLAAYSADGSFTSPKSQSAVAALFNASPSLVQSLTGSTPVTLPPGPIDALNHLSDLLDICGTLGVNGDALTALGAAALASTSAANGANAADLAAQTVRAAISTKYVDGPARNSVLETYQDQINVIRRDALCDYLINGRPELQFRSHDDLYNYFLLDVDMSGCGRTSRVVAATNSVQLYVQRCILKVEKSNSQPAISASVQPPGAIEQWAWMKNFRVWQANRKVFLYPESYLVPDLRDDKTPLFQDLQDQLLQSQITHDAAAQAYGTYLTGLSELAHQNIVGTYYDRAAATYYFFGRTQQDPPVFHYRTWDSITWSPWKRIDLAIDAPYVSAIMHLGQLYLFWVDLTTKNHTTILKGSSVTDYATVTGSLNYSVRRLGDRWSPPQKIEHLIPTDFPAQLDPAFAGSDIDNLQNQMLSSKISRKVFPTDSAGQLLFTYRNAEVDGAWNLGLTLFLNRLDRTTAPEVVFVDLPTVGIRFDPGVCRLVLERYAYRGGDSAFDIELEVPEPTWGPFTALSMSFKIKGTDLDHYQGSLLHAVHGGFPESVLLLGDQQFLVQDRYHRFFDAAAPGSAGSFPLAHSHSIPESIYPAFFPSRRKLVRLSTSVVDRLGEKMAAQGLDGLLDLNTQIAAKEIPPTVGQSPIIFTNPTELAPPEDDSEHLDLNGAFGGYFQELYLHGPWLIADQLNAGGKYAEAMSWLQRIFDPTASPAAVDLTPEDRNWRYVGFRGLTPPTLKDLLSNPKALDAYRADPFNPFAVARLRPIAFQKAIVMRFIDNLLDWGDALFGEDNRESIHEALMLYVLASELLGPRPVSTGPCESVPDSQLTYSVIEPQLDSTSDFVVAMENFVVALENYVAPTPPTQTPPPGPIPDPAAGPTPNLSIYKMPSLAEIRSLTTARAAAKASWLTAPIPKTPAPNILNQSTLAFCLPPDEVLLSYWDRVNDRLRKIRNCMNISGTRRQLALFSPPIDPMDLVRARAAGLSIEDVVDGVGAVRVPIYRFNALIDRARQAAQTVAAFGSALLSTHEKKDIEELNLLRSLHERTILNLTTQIKTGQLKETQDQHVAALSVQANVQNRIDYYRALLDAGLLAEEASESQTKRQIPVDRGHLAALHLQASLLYLIPQFGSPFAMTFGGRELGGSTSALAGRLDSFIQVDEEKSSAWAVNSGFQRREQDWQHQLNLAIQEKVQSDAGVAAALERTTYAERELSNHLKSIDQAAETDAFYKGKFTDLGLYTYLSRSLTTMHARAYEAALDLARQAQDAFTFELDDPTTFIQRSWDPEKAGLLSGERLHLQLLQLENAFLSGNTRRYEVSQSFPLAMIDPQALLALKQTGTCNFTLPEFLFDVTYPGQYKRVIKSARLTIPGIVGPYVNVGAKLTLAASKCRLTANPAPTALVDVIRPPELTSSIATSTGLNDAGLFEMNFHDDRYLPFEGAGAVDSTWKLALPNVLRPFDYQSISDVILTLSYTAKDDDAFRETIEKNLIAQVKAYAAAPGPGLVRMFSLKRDFPDAFAKLISAGPFAPISTTATISLAGSASPRFLTGANLGQASMQIEILLKKPAKGQIDTLILANEIGVSVEGKNPPPWVWNSTGICTAVVPVSDTWTGEIEFLVNVPSLALNDMDDIILMLRSR
ncbi:hypothetical protein ABIB25_004161 [Nakamurella sp. UYEF19]|uniref:Tc toxin subunit A-related protein n=1 Tax=Nakamurella sp. UYEF19 TaxID=1756392 RepID=UPI0033989CAE